mmetsp:Transcript_32360/g.52143  ORF Transcript_32360/g.52143 Transcript_32360/m.52143 type:complete len:88 (+) Transcript_32360:157-420(+)
MMNICFLNVKFYFHEAVAAHVAAAGRHAAALAAAAAAALGDAETLLDLLTQAADIKALGLYRGHGRTFAKSLARGMARGAAGVPATG